MTKIQTKKFEKRKYTFGVAVGNSMTLWKPYLFGGSTEEGIIKARKWGYEAVELHNIIRPRDNDVKRLREIAEKNGIDISAISTGPAYYFDKLNLTDDSKKIRKKSVERLMEYIDIAYEFNSMVTIGTMRGNIPDIEANELFKKRLISSLKEASFYSSERKVTLLLEAANRYEINYLNRVNEIHDLINSNDISMLKIHMDTFHMNIEEADIDLAIKKYGDLLGYFHVADSNRRYPGAGHIDFNLIALDLDYVNYEGYIVVECLPLPDGETAASRALKYMEKIFRNGDKNE